MNETGNCNSCFQLINCIKVFIARCLLYYKNRIILPVTVSPSLPESTVKILCEV